MSNQLFADLLNDPLINIAQPAERAGGNAPESPQGDLFQQLQEDTLAGFGQPADYLERERSFYRRNPLPEDPIELKIVNNAIPFASSVVRFRDEYEYSKAFKLLILHHSFLERPFVFF
jgi:hypothetical protein